MAWFGYTAGMRQTLPDPRCDELDRWLASLKQYDELIERIALRGMSQHCSGDVRWNMRVEKLMQGMTQKQVERVYMDATRRGDAIKAAIQDQLADVHFTSR